MSFTPQVASSLNLLCVLTFMLTSAIQFWNWFGWIGVVIWCGLAALLNNNITIIKADQNSTPE